MFERYSEAARLALFAARHEASEAASHAIEPAHLLLGLLEVKGGVAATLGGAAGLNADDIRPRLLSAAPTPLRTSVEVPFAPAAKAVLQAAVAEADAMGCTEITTGHLLLGLVRDEDSAVSIVLREASMGLDALRTAVLARATKEAEMSAPDMSDVFYERIRRLGLE